MNAIVLVEGGSFSISFGEFLLGCIPLLLFSCIVTLIFSVIYNYGAENRLTRKQYWLIVLVLTSLLSIVFGGLCL